MLNVTLHPARALACSVKALKSYSWPGHTVKACVTVNCLPTAALLNCAIVAFPSATESTVTLGSVESMLHPGTEPSVAFCEKFGLRTIFAVELQASWRCSGVAGVPRLRSEASMSPLGEELPVGAGLISKKELVEGERASARVKGRMTAAGAVTVSTTVVVMTWMLVAKVSSVTVTVTATVGQSEILPVPGGI